MDKVWLFTEKNVVPRDLQRVRLADAYLSLVVQPTLAQPTWRDLSAGFLEMKVIGVHGDLSIPTHDGGMGPGKVRQGCIGAV